MRPQDIVVLLKIAAKQDQPWTMKNIAAELQISASEVTESLARSVFAGLIGSDKMTLQKSALLLFLQYGLQYVFPVKPGTLVSGIPTANSAPPLRGLLPGQPETVWALTEGGSRGLSIEPLIPSLPSVVLSDPRFYELMALTESLRIGDKTEHQLASEALFIRL